MKGFSNKIVPFLALLLVQQYATAAAARGALSPRDIAWLQNVTNTLDGNNASHAKQCLDEIVVKIQQRPELAQLPFPRTLSPTVNLSAPITTATLSVYAVERGNLALFKLLIQAGINPLQKVDLQTTAQNTITISAIDLLIERASHNPHAEYVEFLMGVIDYVTQQNALSVELQTTQKGLARLKPFIPHDHRQVIQEYIAGTNPAERAIATEVFGRLYGGDEQGKTLLDHVTQNAIQNFDAEGNDSLHRHYPAMRLINRGFQFSKQRSLFNGLGKHIACSTLLSAPYYICSTHSFVLLIKMLLGKIDLATTAANYMVICPCLALLYFFHAFNKAEAPALFQLIPNLVKEYGLAYKMGIIDIFGNKKSLSLTEEVGGLE